MSRDHDFADGVLLCFAVLLVLAYSKGEKVMTVKKKEPTYTERITNPNLLAN